MSEDVTLKPCPFCGGTPTVITDDFYDGLISIECCQVGCRANVQGETYDLNEKDKAIEHWNTRAGEDERIAQAVAAERARIVERLEWVLRNKGGVMPFDTAINIVKGE